MIKLKDLLTEIKIKVLSGHLTTLDKKVVKQMLVKKLNSGRVKKSDYFIKDLGKGQYEITQRTMDAGIGLGSKKVLRNYKSKIQVKESLIIERVDFHQIATELVKKYKLKSKVKIGSGKNFGEYIPETDTITLRPSYSTLKEFYMTVLHEIQHALDADNLELAFKVIVDCVDHIYEGDKTYPAKDSTKQELKDFIENMSQEAFKKIRKFFDTMPHLRHEIEVVNPKTKVKNKISFKGIQDFFQ